MGIKSDVKKRSYTFPLTTAPDVKFVLSMIILNTRCDRELSEFIFVDATWRDAEPSSNNVINSSADEASLTTAPPTTTIPYYRNHIKVIKDIMRGSSCTASLERELRVPLQFKIHSPTVLLCIISSSASRDILTTNKAIFTLRNDANLSDI